MLKQYFENTFMMCENDLVYDNPDCIACIVIDGYDSNDDDAEGEVIAETYLTKHGDIVVSWHDNGYREVESVKELIEENKRILNDIAAEEKTKTDGETVDTYKNNIAIVQAMLSKCKNILNSIYGKK